MISGLTRVQRGMLRDLIVAWGLSNVAVLLCARRIGKSHLVCAYLDEVARSTKGALLVYAAATQVSVRNFSGPIMDVVIAARGGVRPEWRAQESMWFYPDTGSRILLVGCDDRHKVDRLRGQAAHVVVVDEAATIAGLTYALGSVFMPLLATTGGRMLVASSGAFSAQDDFAQLTAEARAKGTLVVRTIDDADPGIVSPEWIESYAQSVGGRGSATFQREMLCRTVSDASTSVVPEWQAASADIVSEPAFAPDYAHRYTVLDVGHVDMTVAAIGYAWWEEATPVVTDEVVMQRATSPQIAQAVLDAERLADARMGLKAQGRRRRFADVTPQTCADLRLAGLDVTPLVKGDVLASTARLRSHVQMRRLLVAPRCETIAAHAESAQWAPSGRDMRRVQPTETTPGHHYDGVAALRYFVDVCDLKTDPRPEPMSLARQAAEEILGKGAGDRRVRALSALSRSRGGQRPWWTER